MTSPAPSSSPGRAERRSEFTDFFRATYPALTAELLALTGAQQLARTAAVAAFVRAWRAWPSVRALDRPQLWVRMAAIDEVDRPGRARRVFMRKRAAAGPVDVRPEDAVLIAELGRLPAGQRRLLVLHHMAQLPVETVVDRFGSTAAQLETQLDEASVVLVDRLAWLNGGRSVPMSGDDATRRHPADDASAWTAEALADSARRLRRCIDTPSPAVVFRRAAAARAMQRGLPVVGAAAAVCAGIVVHLSSPESSAAIDPPPAPPSAANQAPSPAKARGDGTAAPAGSAGADGSLDRTTRPTHRTATRGQATEPSRLGTVLATAAGSAREQAIATVTASAAVPRT